MAGRGVRLAARLALLAAASAYSWWAASRPPFSPGADIATAVPLALAASALAWTWATGPGAAPTPGVRLAPWGVLAVAVATLELVSYFSAPRHQHPTLSSIYDAAARYQALKTLAFLAWLRLGYALVRR